MSTFGLISTAYSGLAAARAALDTTGQNVANVNTKGYTRQRVDQQSIGGVGNSTLFTNGLNIGQGVQVTGISRLGDSLVEARVRDTATTDGYWTAASTALTAVETGLAEPGDTGLSSTLNDFWNAWQTMGNDAGQSGAAADLLTKAATLTGRLSAGYATAAKGWSDTRAAAAVSVTTVNDTARQIASLNKQIIGIRATGGNANDLVDQRTTAIAGLAALTGATTRQNTDGTVDVILGGSTLVAGTTARSVALNATPSMEVAASTPLRLEFTDRPGVAVQVDGGTLAAQLATLAPASGGSGGVFAETAAAYDAVATKLADRVNALHAQGTTPSGQTGKAFFALGAGHPATSLSVVPTDVSGIAAGGAGRGGNDGSNAQAISDLQDETGSPDRLWTAFVTRIGSQVKAAATQASVASAAATAATTAQSSQSGVDLDEETANLVVFQHAYQGAARVLTAVDEMLDTLINRTGVVGRA